MLIVPADARFRQGRWPVMTALLIAANVFVFFVLQGRDAEHQRAAFELYFRSDLPAIELPLYVADLRARGKSREAEALQRHLDERHGLPVLIALERDAAFKRRLHDGDAVPAAQRADWQAQRARFDAARARAVTERFAFHPDDPSAVTLLTSMFLHGGVDHLLGNMVVLGLVGVLVEYALGPLLFAALYLAGGLAAGAAYWLVNAAGTVPVVGASGAIAAVMGLFAVLYGLRKVRFFYTVLFYFDFVTLPALILLPYWLGWEVLQFFISEDPVAYEAHAGGLVAGALLAVAARRRAPAAAQQSLDRPELDARWEAELRQGLAQMGRLDFARARATLEKLHAQRPADLRPLQHLFRIARAQPASEAFHRHAQALLAARPPDLPRLFDEYCQHARPGPRLDAKLQLQLLNRFALANDCARVDRLLQMAPAPGQGRAIAAILDALAPRVPPEKGRAYRELAGRLASG